MTSTQDQIDLMLRKAELAQDWFLPTTRVAGERKP